MAMVRSLTEALYEAEGQAEKVPLLAEFAETYLKRSEKSEAMVADLRRLLVATLHHKAERNLAMNEPHHVSLENELAMLRLLINKRGAGVSPQEMADYLEEEKKRAAQIDGEMGVH